MHILMTCVCVWIMDEILDLFEMHFVAGHQSCNCAHGMRVYGLTGPIFWFL
jgi:hypothetical protein